jgi:putative flippase GtrA
LNGVVATTSGFLLSAAVNFFSNYHFTFHSKAPWVDSLRRFIIMIALGLALNASIFWLLVSRLSLSYLVGQVIATGIVLLWNFTFSCKVVYPTRSQRVLY